MVGRLKLLCGYIISLIIVLFLLFITYQYTVSTYSRNKLQAQETVIQLQSQLDYLEKQSSKPKEQLKPEILKEYDQKYNTNLQVEMEHAMSVSSHGMNFAPQDIETALQALKAEKRQQIKALKERSFFSYVPEWPILILGIIGIVATRIINLIFDFCKDWLCSIYAERQKRKKGSE